MKVSWDDDIPNMEKKMFQTTNQAIYRGFPQLAMLAFRRIVLSYPSCDPPPPAHHHLHNLFGRWC